MIFFEKSTEMHLLKPSGKDVFEEVDMELFLIKNVSIKCI